MTFENLILASVDVVPTSDVSFIAVAVFVLGTDFPAFSLTLCGVVVIESLSVVVDTSFWGSNDLSESAAEVVFAVSFYAVVVLVFIDDFLVLTLSDVKAFDVNLDHNHVWFLKWFIYF